MKIKLRSDDSGPPGPTEWSEMNDWLANLREDADPEPAATVGQSSTAEPPGTVSAAQPLSAAVPEPYDPAEARPFGAAQAQDGAAPAATAESQADHVTAEAHGASPAYAVDEPYGAAALDEGDGFHGHYGDYDLEGGHSGPHEADTAEPAVTVAPGDTAAAPRTSGASWAPVAPVAPTYAAGPVTPEAWMAPVASGVPAAPVFAARPTAPGAVTPAAAAPAPAPPAPVAEPELVVRALIGEDLRTPMVWCELEPGSCVSWHGDREALGMADVRARAIAAGWRIDALGRLTCPQCQQRSTIFRATQQVVLWNRGYAMTMAAREAARQGNYPYPQPAFYPR